MERATQNEVVALSLYWYVKVEIKDTRVLNTSQSTSGISSIPSSVSTNSLSSNPNNNSSQDQTTVNDIVSKSNFQIFMDELLDNLRNVFFSFK